MLHLHLRIFSIFLQLLVLSRSWELRLSKSYIEKIKFLLWTRSTGNTSQVIQPSAESLHNSSFSLTSPVILLIHGWRSDGVWFGDFYRAAYLEAGDFNIISVDWGDLESINYLQAAALTKPVADHTTKLVKIMKDLGIFDNIHVVGHSLGAHVAGFIGQKVQQMGLGTLKRITGLDRLILDLGGMVLMEDWTKLMQNLLTSSTQTVACCWRVH